jgi:hypothetical protein
MKTLIPGSNTPFIFWIKLSKVMKKLLSVPVLLSVFIAGAQQGNQRPITHRPSDTKADTLPVAKGVNTVAMKPGTIKLPNVLSVPAEAFRPSNETGNNGYYKIRRDGLGTLAGSGETINNSLVAPLNLPHGAVINKIEFNMLSLYPHGYFPHLSLVARGVVNSERQKGGYLGITRVTKYSVNSFSLSNESGLMDIKTLVTDKMDYKINNQSGSYYLEVLANKNPNGPMTIICLSGR